MTQYLHKNKAKCNNKETNQKTNENKQKQNNWMLIVDNCIRLIGYLNWLVSDFNTGMKHEYGFIGIS